MNVNAQVAKRFQELETQGKAIPIKPAGRMEGGDTADPEAFQYWASSAMHLVASIFGQNSPHCRNFETAYKQFQGYAYHLGPVRGVFSAAKSDYEDGYLFTVESAISGEIFGDFVSAAKTALSQGQKDVAAVLACAALEDALKRFAKMQGVIVDNKDMTEVINALKAAGLLSGPQKSLVDVMPKVRNAAMHAEWDKITQQDVGSVIGFVEQFLLTKFA